MLLDRPLLDPDEGRYSAVALNMIASGDYLQPRLNDVHVHLTKPPATYWAIAASVQLFGVHDWAIRLPNWIAFLLTVLLVKALATRLVASAPWLATYTYMTCLVPAVAMLNVNTDTLLTLALTLLVYCYVRGWAAGTPLARDLWRYAMWLAFGLGVLVKGPAALVPLIAITAFEWSSPADNRLGIFRPGPMLLGALVGAIWHVWLIIGNPELIRYFVGYEFLDRVYSDVHDRHAGWTGAFTVYGPVLALALLPFSDVLLRNLRRLPSPWKALATYSALPPAPRLLLCWTLIPLLLFALAQSRLYAYILPTMVPLALLLARLIAEHSAGLPRWRVIGHALLLIGLLYWASTLEFRRDGGALAAAIRSALPDDLQPHRALFIDTSARYSQTRYLGIAVEEVSTAGARLYGRHQLRTPTEACSTTGTTLIIADNRAGAIHDCLQTASRCGGLVVEPLIKFRDLAIATTRCTGR